MAPFEHMPENTGLLAGIAASVVGVWIAITGRSRERIERIAVDGAERSGKFVLRAAQDEINAGVQRELGEIKDTTNKIYDYLIGRG